MATGFLLTVPKGPPYTSLGVNWGGFWEQEVLGPLGSFYKGVLKQWQGSKMVLQKTSLEGVLSYSGSSPKKLSLLIGWFWLGVRFWVAFQSRCSWMSGV